MNSKSTITVTGAEIGNIVFELDEACAALRINEDEHKFAVDAIVAAWNAQFLFMKLKRFTEQAQLSSKKVK
jgi:hypothetical protein